jgi:glycosyltransferase involved in cell wall biosynthesis
MKIVHLIFSFSTGGAETMLVDIINEQIKAHQVTLIIINNLVNKALIDKISNGVKVILLGRKEKSRNPLSILKLNYLLVKEKPEVIHCHNESIIRIILSRNKAVFTAHSMQLSTRNLKYYKKVLAISQAVKTDVEGRSNIKPILVYNGINNNLIKRKTNYYLNTFRIVQIGRLDHSIKGQHVLLDALNRLVHARGINNINVDFIGEGKSLEFLQNLARSYQLENHVNFLGIKDRSYIYEHLKDYDLFVQPSLHEGFGLTVIEAMSAKVPVLVADIDGPAEIIENGRYGFLFSVGNSDDCAKAIIDIINTYGSNEIMEKINSAYTRATKLFNIDVMVHTLLNIYLI